MMRSMVIDMNDEQLHTLAELQVILDGAVAVDFLIIFQAFWIQSQTTQVEVHCVTESPYIF